MVTVLKDLTNTMGTDSIYGVTRFYYVPYNTYSLTEVALYFSIYGPLSTGQIISNCMFRLV